MFKIIILAACFTVVISARYTGGDYGYHDKYYHPHPKLRYQNDYNHHSYPRYIYRYGVNDGHTQDHKSAWEYRDGDVVKGQYSLAEADGTYRVVDYISGPKTGLQVHVQRTGYARHPHGVSYVKIDQHF